MKRGLAREGKEVLKMDYKNNIENQRELLQKHLEAINIVVSAKLGIKVNLRIEENKDYRNQTFFSLIDDRNIKKECGVMESAFRNVYIETFGVWWQENGVSFELDFKAEDYYCNHDGENCPYYKPYMTDAEIEAENKMIEKMENNA